MERKHFRKIMNPTTSNAADINTQILDIINKHALKAQASEYDRSVALTAIASARARIEEVLVEGSADCYGLNVLSCLALLYENYNDLDGQYTNGRGVLGSLIGDLQSTIIKATIKSK